MWIELEEYERAFEDFERAIDLDPNDPMHLGNEGVLLLEAGAPDIAATCFRHTIDLDPDNPIHHNNIGMAYRETGDPETANRSFMRAIGLGDQQFRASMEAAGA